MFITFGTCNLKKIIFFSVPLIKLIRESALFSKAFYGVNNIIMQYLFLCVAKLANVIFWFILIKKTKISQKFHNVQNEENIRFYKEQDEEDGEKRNNIKNSLTGFSQKELNRNEQENKRKKKICKELFILILSSLLDFISSLTYLVSYASISNNNSENTSTQDNSQSENMINLIPFRIICRITLMYILSLIILYSNRPHRHQILSIILIIIFLIFANIIEIFLGIIKKEKYILIHFIISFLQEFLFCLDYVVGAKYLSISKGNLYKLLFAKGLFGIIGITIIHFLIGFIHCSDLYLKEKYCVEDNLKYFYDLNIDKIDIKVFKLITSLILSIVELACTWLLIFYQTVNHLTIACAIHLTHRFLTGRKEFNINHFIISIICLILVILFSLIYNEIIVLKICNLDKNTSEEIEKRAAEEQIIEEKLFLENSLEGINSSE